MNWRRQAATALALALVGAACANTDTSTDDATTAGGTPAAAADTDAESESESESTPPGEETTSTAEGPYEHLAAAEAGEYEGETVEILGQWVEAEGDNFEAVLSDFADRTGIDVVYEGITDYETVLNVRVEGGNAPDIAQLAQPGLMRAFADEGHLVDLSEWINTDQLEADYAEAYLDLAAHDGGTYGVFYKASTKSIVWYPVAAFEEAGYEIPATWDDLVALSDQIVADGNGNPWCISVEHGDASGWVATDWIEDVLLRTAEPEIYDQWVAHEIPFDHPEVVEAAEIVKDIWFTEDYVYGGNTAINATFVGDTQNPMFEESGPECWMHKQAAWIPDFWPVDPATEEPLFTPGEDSAFFYFPPIDDPDARPVLGSGDMMVMFDDRPAVRAVMEFLATAEGAKAWIEAGGFISPNSSVPTDWYADYASSEQARILADATTLRFDASDTMPADVGQGTFWSGMIEWISANGEGTEQVLADIEASWPDS